MKIKNHIVLITKKTISATINRLLLVLIGFVLVISQTPQIRSFPHGSSIAHAQEANQSCPVRPQGTYYMDWAGTITSKEWSPKPVANAAIRVTIARATMADGPTFTATTDANGKYNLGHLNIGYQNAKATITVTPLSGSIYRAWYQETTVSENDPSHTARDFQLPILHDRTLYGSVRTENWATTNPIPPYPGISGVTVRLYDRDDFKMVNLLATTTTNQYGHFALPGNKMVANREYSLQASKDNLPISSGVTSYGDLAEAGADLNTPYPVGSIFLDTGTIILDGQATFKNTPFSLSYAPADITVTQNNKTFHPQNASITDGKYRIETHPDFTDRLLPGSATFKLSTGGVEFVNTTIQIKSGRNFLNPKLDIALVCGSIGLKDTQLMFSGVEVQFQKAGSAVYSFTTDSDGRYKSFSEDTKTTNTGSSYSINTTKLIPSGSVNYRVKFPVEEVPFFARLSGRNESTILSTGVTEKVESFREEESNGINATITFADGKTHPKSAYRISASRVGVANPKTRNILTSRLTNSDGNAILTSDIFPYEENGVVNPIALAAYALDKNGKDLLVSKEYQIALKKGELGVMKSLTVVIDKPIDNDRSPVAIKARARLTKGSNLSPVSNATVKLTEESGEQISGTTNEKGLFTASLKMGVIYDLTINFSDPPREYKSSVSGRTRQEMGATKPSLSIQDLTQAIWGNCFEGVVSNIKRFFFCGEESIKAQPELRPQLSEISASSLALSKKYPTFTGSLPTFTQIADYIPDLAKPPNAHIEYKYYGSIFGEPCPPRPIFIESEGRYYNYGITFDLPFIQRLGLTPTATRNAFYHEDGHLLDALRGSDGGGKDACKVHYSEVEESPFSTVEHVLAAYYWKKYVVDSRSGPPFISEADTEWSYITDRSYLMDRNIAKAGHPWDNPAELYASAFMIGNLYRDKFNENIKSFADLTEAGMNAKNAMIEAVRLATDF